MGEEYKFDAFDDGSWKLVGEQQMVKIRHFIEEYSSQLHEIEETLDETLCDVWDFVADPIGLWLEPYEQTNVVELVKTDNPIFNKLTIVFSYITLEIHNLKEIAQSKFIPAILSFGQELRSNPIEGDAQVHIGKMLPFIQDLSSFVKRCYSVVQNLVRQLAALYNKSQKIYQQSYKSVHLIHIFYKLADMLVLLITLDEVIIQNWEFNQSWAMYRRMTKTIRPEAQKYHTDEDQLLQFDKHLEEIEGQLFYGLIFQNCIEQDFDCADVVTVQKNELFSEEFFLNIKSIYNRLVTPRGEFNEILYRQQYMGLCSLYVFYQRLYNPPKPDMKFFKGLWELHKKTPVLHLAGNAAWFPTDFFAKKIPGIVKALGKDANVEQWKRDYVKTQEQLFANMVQQYYLQVSMWMIKMESNLTHKSDIRQTLNVRATLMTKGLILANDVSNLFKEYIDLHTGLKIPVKPSHVRPLCQCVEIIKAIQGTFHRRSTVIGESMPYMVQQVSFSLQRMFMPIRVRLEDNKYSDYKLDVLAAIHLAMHMLNGAGTIERRTLLRLSLHSIFQISFLKEGDVEDIRNLVSKLDLLCEFQEFLRNACDCSFLFWSKVLLPAYFQDIYQNPDQANRLNYMFAAFRDVGYLFSKSAHVPSATLVDEFKKEIHDALKENVMMPLCRSIETDLRFHIHAHLNVSERDPWKSGIKNLVSFVKLKPLRFFDENIDIKGFVEHYLDTTFYNLNTVALFDWKTYAEMRNLANQKYLLELTEVHLPGQTLEQGLDVLEIMRNIHIFVSRYNYNLNNQIFVERNSESKFLNTINITHIANSIRTHGTGIMNTTVNFTFQFLKRKFAVFSQFLFDEHIKARLYKDIRFFKESNEKLDRKYPFERADKFNKDIRKLGMTPDGLSYLDQFRVLITEIGNAMGYIRMIRSGGLHFTSNAIKFVPDLQDVLQFEDLAKKEGLSSETNQSMHNLDSTIENLSKNFAEGTEYFKMLVMVFATEFRNTQNAHLKNFHIILPPLIINYIDHILVTKDKLTKKGGKQDGSFTDDGFAIGVAYILKLLDLNKEFDALHWFDSVALKYEEDRVKYTKLAEQKGVKLEEKQTLSLTINKIRNYQREYEQFRYSFSGARIFFKNE